MKPVHWLDRLKLYLAPLRRSGRVDIWDDSRIEPGTLWRKEIAKALDASTASILLVGPAFLASDFVVTKELPRLLAAASRRGARIYPLVVGHCSYQTSSLAPYQAFNTPEKPLEALRRAKQNEVLNNLSLKVDADLRHSAPSALQTSDDAGDTRDALARIAKEMDKTATAFDAQCRRRDLLYEMLVKRLKAARKMEFEAFFSRYHPKLNDEERFHFQQIRATTEGLLHDGNETILRIMDEHPATLDEVPSLQELRQHIVFWLNKYEKVFAVRPDMCVLYTGVEDGVPFPSHAEKDVAKWLRSRRPRDGRG